MKGETMRQLMVRQKKLLDKWYSEAKVNDWDNLTLEQQEQLEHINDTEILYQEVNRYLWDLRFK